MEKRRRFGSLTRKNSLKVNMICEEHVWLLSCWSTSVSNHLVLSRREEKRKRREEKRKRREEKRKRREEKRKRSEEKRKRRGAKSREREEGKLKSGRDRYKKNEKNLVAGDKDFYRD